jgi:hypothetical protein
MLPIKTTKKIENSEKTKLRQQNSEEKEEH